MKSSYNHSTIYIYISKTILSMTTNEPENCHCRKQNIHDLFIQSFIYLFIIVVVAVAVVVIIIIIIIIIVIIIIIIIIINLYLRRHSFIPPLDCI